MKNLFVAAVMVLFLAGSASAAAPRIRPGKWQVTSTMQMPPGIPFSPPPTTRVSCISKKDADSGNAFRTIPKNCHEDYFRAKGKTAQWKISCKGKGSPMTMLGKLVSNTGTSYEVRVTNKAGSRVVGGMKISGKRIGECP